MRLVVIDKGARDFYMHLTNIYSKYRMVGVNYYQTIKAILSNFPGKRVVALFAKLNTDTKTLIKLTR